LLYMKHGGEILADDAAEAADAVGRNGHVALTRGAFDGRGRRTRDTPFDYLVPELKDHPSGLPGDPEKVMADLNALGAAMVEADPPEPLDSTTPAIYTYWGQFIDHDLTANTDRDSRVSDITKGVLTPIPPDDVASKLHNLRRPTLDLDSVYGDGPGEGGADAGMYDGARFRVGANHTDGVPGERIPPEDDLQRDLPRIGTLLDAGVIADADLPPDLRADPSKRTRALIGDLRNDENLVIAQFHLAFLRFHNRIVDLVEDDPKAFGLWPWSSRMQRFEVAQRLTRLHYQWLVVHDYLRTVTLPGIVDKLLLGGLQHYKPLHTRRGRELFMPLEHAVAAFRFGHSMVRGGYDFNRNFGTPAPGTGGPLIPFAPFDLLFQFTGNGFARDPQDPSKSVRSPFGDANVPTLPFNWIAEFDRLCDKSGTDPQRFARKIDTHVVPPVLEMVNEGTGSAIQDDASKPVRELLRHLARRNLLRGYLLSIPTGQRLAAAMGVAPLTLGELRRDNSAAVDAALEQGGFLQHTPLWYYVLKEAEVRGNGNTLGELGSRIVCETILGLLRHDRNSFLNERGGWDPSEGVRLPDGDPIVTVRDFLAFTGVPA
jgi:hypothetical protein